MPVLLPPDTAVFFDLDGTLLDPAERYWRLHCALVAPHGGPRADQASYWALKRERTPLEDVLVRTAPPGVDPAAYHRAWLERIETTESLRHDRLIPGVRETLAALGATHPLVLVTLRRQRDHLLAQLTALALLPAFTAVLTAAPEAADDWRVKQRLIGASPHCRAGATVVGDTEADLRAGKALALRTVAVCSGLRSRARLAAEGPDAILDSVAALRDTGRP